MSLNRIEQLNPNLEALYHAIERGNIDAVNCLWATSDVKNAIANHPQKHDERLLDFCKEATKKKLSPILNCIFQGNFTLFIDTKNYYNAINNLLLKRKIGLLDAVLKQNHFKSIITWCLEYAEKKDLNELYQLMTNMFKTARAYVCDAIPELYITWYLKYVAEGTDPDNAKYQAISNILKSKKEHVLKQIINEISWFIDFIPHNMDPKESKRQAFKRIFATQTHTLIDVINKGNPSLLEVHFSSLNDPNELEEFIKLLLSSLASKNNIRECLIKNLNYDNHEMNIFILNKIDGNIIGISDTSVNKREFKRELIEKIELQKIVYDLIIRQQFLPNNNQIEYSANQWENLSNNSEPSQESYSVFDYDFDSYVETIETPEDNSKKRKYTEEQEDVLEQDNRAEEISVQPHIEEIDETTKVTQPTSDIYDTYYNISGLTKFSLPPSPPQQDLSEALNLPDENEQRFEF